MGIYDRDYVRREGPSFLGSITERGTVCKWLIGINVVLFIAQVVTSAPGKAWHGPVTQALALDVSRVLDGQVWRLLTAAFLHDPNDPWHILFNMLCLFWFGREMEDLYGKREFLAFYLVAALMGNLAFLLTHLSGHAVALGASGATTAVLLLFACHYPSRVVYLMGVVPLPVWLLVVISVGWDAMAWASHAQTGVAVTAHLGGAGATSS
jgi:membrane associated rhomboid family serine protease